MSIRSEWTRNSQYYIDFERGSVVHSSATSRGQNNRLFKDVQLGGVMKYMTNTQATDFYQKLKIG
jgi:hypothetical protein